MEGLKIEEISIFEDGRGWLGEILRDDESEHRPRMSYISMTKPGHARGPHEHNEQTDFFCFMGKFRLYFWDNRESSATYRQRMVFDTTDVPTVATVPPGIVHAYKNLGSTNGIVFNLPDKLYRGKGKTGPVDEVRYEEDLASPYRLDE